MDKELIRSRFTKALGSYSGQAYAQQRIAEHMANLMAERLPVEALRRVLEVGCGNGGFTRLMLEKFRPESLWLNDLCDGANEHLADVLSSGEVANVSFLPGDAESLTLPEGLDLMVSCSAVQWFEDPIGFVLRSAEQLANNGFVAFSTFGRQNLCEVTALTGKGLIYPDASQWREALSSAFDIICAEEQTITLVFDDAMHLLRHLKETGVTGLSRNAWTPADVRNFARDYAERFSDDSGRLTLTYHPIYFIAQKRHHEL